MKHSMIDQLCEINDCFFQQEEDILNDILNDMLFSYSNSQPMKVQYNSHSQLNDSIHLRDQNSLLSTEENESQTHESDKTERKNKKLKPHLSNLRRKKEQREVLKILVQVAIQSSKSTLTQKQLKSLPQHIGQLTKNLLAFAKYAHFQFLEAKLSKKYFDDNTWLEQIRNKDGITVKDYDALYKCHELRDLLKEFFYKKILYRELMISRTIPVNKVLYMYFLEIFEINFNKKEFKGISETKVNIEENKAKKLRKMIKKS